MNDVFEDFKLEYLAYHDISEQRRRDSRRSLTALEKCAGVGALDVEGPHVQRWFATMVEEGKAPTTVRKHRGLILPFYGWAHGKRLIDQDRLTEIKRVRLPRGASSQGLPRPYSREEIQQLWSDVGEAHEMLTTDAYLRRYVKGTSPYRRIREHCAAVQLRAIVAVCLFGGLRMRECYELTERNAHYENAYIVVGGACKNPRAVSVEREVPWMTDEMRQYVKDWIDLRAILQPDHGLLWLSLHARDMRPARWRTFQMVMHDLGEGWEFHRLRHTAGTEMVRAGMRVEKVQKVLGHARIQQTLNYVKVAGSDVRESARQASAAMSSALAPR